MSAGRIVGGATAAVLLGIGFLAACGGDDDAAPVTPAEGGIAPGDSGALAVDAGPTPTDVCKAYIEALCDRADECGIASASCAVTEALCPDYLFGPGSARTVADVVACAATRRQQPCGEIAAGITPSCATPGTLPAGAPCNFFTDCASSTCANGGAGACGQCAAPSTDGGCTPSCEDLPRGPCIACGANEECAQGTCRPRVPSPELDAGAPCDSSLQRGVCATSLRCLARNAGERSGTCVTPPTAGQPCLFDVFDSQHACATGHCGGQPSDPPICVDAPGAEGTICARSEDCEAPLACSLAGGLCTKPSPDGTLCPIIPATTSARGTCARTSICKPVPSAGDLEGRCTASLPEGSICSKGDDLCTPGTACRATVLVDGGLGPTLCLRGSALAALGEPCTLVEDCAPNAICSTAHLCALPICQ